MEFELQKYLLLLCFLFRRELDEFEELQKRERDCLEMIKEQTAKVYQAHRLHHLLSTKQVSLQELKHTQNLTHVTKKWP